MLYSLEIYNSQGFSFGICGFIGFKLGFVHEHKFMFCKFTTFVCELVVLVDELTAFVTCRKCDFKFGLFYRIF